RAEPPIRPRTPPSPGQRWRPSACMRRPWSPCPIHTWSAMACWLTRLSSPTAAMVVPSPVWFCLKAKHSAPSAIPPHTSPRIRIRRPAARIKTLVRPRHYRSAPKCKTYSIAVLGLPRCSARGTFFRCSPAAPRAFRPARKEPSQWRRVFPLEPCWRWRRNPQPIGRVMETSKRSRPMKSTTYSPMCSHFEDRYNGGEGMMRFRLLAVMFIAATAACSNADLYTISGHGPGGPDRTSFAGTVCTPLASGDVFPVKIIYAIQGGQNVPRDFVSVVVDSLNQPPTLPGLKFELIAFHTVATGLQGSFVDASGLQAAAIRYNAYQES